jgi:hypothetical protein
MWLKSWDLQSERGEEVRERRAISIRTGENRYKEMARAKMP